MIVAGGIGVTTATAQPEGTVDAVSHDQTVAADGSFQISIETSNSAGTTVAVEPEGFDVDLSSDDGSTDGNRVRFLDVSAGDSMHTVTADVTGGVSGDTAEIIVWVNAGDRADATDEHTSTIEISGSDSHGSTGGAGSDDDDDGDSNGGSGGGQSDTDTSSSDASRESDSADEKENTDSTSSDEETSESDVSADTNESSSTDTVENTTNESETGSGTDDSAPGFGIGVTIASLAMVGYLVSRVES